MNKSQVISIMAFLLPLVASLGQPGGKAFQFLETTNSARIASIGGKAVAVVDNDLNLTYYNPSLLQSEMDNHLVLNYVDYFAGINYGYAAYARHLEKAGTFAAGIHYLNYGTFPAADEIGKLAGEFTAADYALNLMYARPIDSLFTIGANLKPIYSKYELYSAFAVAIDFGITYYNPARLRTLAFVVRNIGSQLKPYYSDGYYEPLPFNMALGYTQGLQHAPFTFYFVIDHLQQLDLTFKTEKVLKEQVDPLTGQKIKENRFDTSLDKAMRHLIVGTELDLTKNLKVRFGYNYRRRQEMKLTNYPGMVGFSWGIGLRISKFHISYGRNAFHAAGSPNYFSLNLNLQEFYRKY